MDTTPDVDRGLTHPLHELLPRTLRPLLDRIDDRAGVAVDDRGVEVRSVVRTRTVPWGEITAIHLESRLDVALAAATRFLPVRRVPLVGGLLTDAVRTVSAAVTRRVASDRRRASGWVMATLERDGLLRPDVDVDGVAFLTALFSDELADALVAHATARDIPVHRT